MAANKVTTLHQDYKAEGFNFNKAFIQKEQLWEGAWQGKQISWYYNKFPFAHHHGLLVPQREKQQAQYLSEANHEFVWRLLDDCADSFSGLGLGYNSLGAFASVNHLHFQWFIEPEGLPVMSSRWQHNGGSLEYPLPCYRYTDPQQAWQTIKTWHEASIPYNLIYSGGSVYAFPRCIQSLITHSDWTSGFSWIETAGEMVIQNATAFEELNARDIEDEMYKLKLPNREL